MNDLDVLIREIYVSFEANTESVVISVEEAKSLVKAYQDLYRECDQLRNELACAKSTQYH